jgi:23S rRNA (cytidine1920-2'-O)/16S rRNA (cytidine1409-2'-O)-methyltransferase
MDVSFISATLVFPAVVAAAPSLEEAVVLVKPQFEAGRDRLGGGGVVRDPAVHAAVLREVRDAMPALGLHAIAAALSPLRGPSGNVEFFYELRREGDDVQDARLDALVAEAHA